jgi:hypothetical protein
MNAKQILSLFTEVPRRGILESSIVHSLRTAQIHRQFIAIHKMEGKEQKRGGRNTRENNRFTFCFEEGKGGGPKGGTDRSILLRVDVGKGE